MNTANVIAVIKIVKEIYDVYITDKENQHGKYAINYKNYELVSSYHPTCRCSNIASSSPGFFHHATVTR